MFKSLYNSINLYLTFFLFIFSLSNLFSQETVYSAQLDTLNKKITLLTNTQIQRVSIDSLDKSEITTINLPNIQGHEFKLIGDFLVHNSGGFVHRVYNDSIYRIDKSFDHKMQYGSHTFMHQDTIFKFGGYGFFQSRNILTYFSKDINEWEIYPINGSLIPKGIHDFTGIYKNGDYWIIGGEITNEFNPRKSDYNDKIYRFSFPKKEWELLGVVSNDLKLKKNYIPIQDKDLIISNRINIIDIKSNQINFSSLTDFTRKLSDKTLIGIYEDNLYFINNDLLNTHRIDKIQVSDILTLNSLEEETLYNPLSFSLVSKTNILLFISISFFVFFVLNLVLSRRLIFWRSDYYRKFKKLNFIDEEKELLNLFVNTESLKYEIENIQILNLVEGGSDQLDHGTITRKKNQLINNLNQKVKGILNTENEIILEKKSHSDNRQKLYSLNKKLIWILN